MATLSNLGSRTKEAVGSAQAKPQTEAGVWGELGSALFESLGAQIAWLDEAGIIVAVNHACHAPEAVTPFGCAFRPGINYLSLCERADAVLATSVRAVLAGERDRCMAHCPAPAPLDATWFRVVVVPAGSGSAGAVAMHVNLTRDLSSADVQAKKMEEVGRLAGGVAHDFANLMTLIAGYAEILSKRVNIADPLRPELEEIQKAANRGASMTAQLLDFIRRQVIQPTLLDLNALVRDMEGMLRPIIGEHIQLLTSYAPELGAVKADPGQMSRVILNLVLNARDAMPKGGRMVIETANVELQGSAAVARQLAPGEYVTMSLSDTGHGMDAEVMDHLFEPFFTTKAKGRGTGLGLSTVYGIVKESQGAIWVDSEPERGSTFTICFPRASRETEAADAAAVGIKPGMGSETILLVEDEDSVRRLLKHVLVSRGYNVLEAGNGPEALEVKRKHPGQVHLLLTDMVMPGMSGRELAQHIREHQPDMKVLYISGYTDDMLLRAGALGPGMSFLQKPLKPDILASKLREILDKPSRQ